MRTDNSNYFNACHFSSKLLLSLFFCFFTACSEQNNPKQILSTENQIQISTQAININTASAAELEKLPHIGAKTAHEIIEHREKFGRFRKPEYLLLVRGISEQRFREIRSLIKVE
ncbi:MAG: helix-hairpin-helix domain-containing protein [Pyrinomonadaceae bacterium]|nr:helix-hairpin-helix domain-containing protein [Pyrinomonadaceae bacterium]